MIAVRAGANKLQIEKDGVQLFDAHAHMTSDRHGGSHECEEDGTKIYLEYAGVTATITVEGDSGEEGKSFTKGVFTNVGGIWLSKRK